MEDKLICIDHFAYSMRIDLEVQYLDNDDHEQIAIEDISKERIKFLELNPKISHYLFYLEKGKITGKLHLQGIIWSKNAFLGKELTRMRQWWKRPKGGISLTKCKNLTSLVSYVAKDGNRPDTNLTLEQLALIPKWIVYDWNYLLAKRLPELVQETNGQHGFCLAIVDFYTLNKRAPPNRACLFKHLLKYHPGFSSLDYIGIQNIFPQDQWNDGSGYTFQQIKE